MHIIKMIAFFSVVIIVGLVVVVLTTQVVQSILKDRNVDEYVFMPINKLKETNDFTIAELDGYSLDSMVYVPVIQYDRQNRSLRNVRVYVYSEKPGVNLNNFEVISEELNIKKFVDTNNGPYKPIWIKNNNKITSSYFISFDVINGLGPERFEGSNKKFIKINLAIKTIGFDDRMLDYTLTRASLLSRLGFPNQL